ncbi:glycosyltransferase [Hirschia maritima]|uniref:glycosyltransferase n=1 Tax=Hirschia maritima TaxID=1121961 RepID=UPI0003A7DB3F|nr:glycosyltransferase [Hirschia maritima]
MQPIPDTKRSREFFILSRSAIISDPRVLRCIQSLSSTNAKVLAFGIEQPNSTASPPGDAEKISPNVLLYNAKIIPDRNRQQNTSTEEKTHSRIGKCTNVLIRFLSQKKRIRRLIYYFNLLIALRFFKCCNPDDIYWQYNPIFRAIHLQVTNCLSIKKDFTTSQMTDLIWVANDWDMLPIAYLLQKEFGGKILYDSHEFAVDQFSHNLQWKIWIRPLTRAIERKYISQVDAIISVSPGICTALKNRYKLPKTPVCVRNIPAYKACEFRPISENSKIRILYQGVVAKGRGLEALIESTPLWKRDFKLVIRGPGQPDYINALDQLIVQTASKIEIEIAPPVPFSELIETAQKSDIGLMLLNNRSVHNKYALPNKLFEYMMAGLAVIVSDVPDMAEIVTNYNTGKVIKSLDPHVIATQINSLTADQINHMKKASLKTSKSLNWEKEEHKFLTTIGSL